MERLSVSDFLSFKLIELDLAKITVIIGSQAQGKSVLAKLVFFFRDLISQYFRKSRFIEQDIHKVAIRDFSQIFPYYSWGNQDFEIIYQLEDFKISLIHQKEKQPILHFSDRLEQVQNFLPINTPVFIPANRSFFANIQTNIFSLLLEEIEIDYFLKRFGKFYQRIKTSLEDLENTPLWDRGSWDLNPEAEDYFKKIIRGKYKYDKGKDWIYFKDDQRINLMNASSGQQEALPIILILVFPGSQKRFFFIEEPEAHLFPTSQKDIVELISLVFNLAEKNNNFFITTHSPYILTAFNNLIQAGNTLKVLQKNAEQEMLQSKLFNIIPKNKILDIDDLGVYSLEDGKLKSIINQDNKLINTNIIDAVSNEISEEFEQLLELEFEE